MRFRVVVTHQRGIPRPKREIAREDGAVGDVITSYQQDPFLRRTVLVATFSDARTEIHERIMLPGLFDARCVLIAAEGQMLAGVERIKIEGGDFVEFAQGWWLRPVETAAKFNGANDERGGCGARHGSPRTSAGDWTKRLK